MHEHRFKVFWVDCIKGASGLELAPHLREHMVDQGTSLHCIQPAARGFRTLGAQAVDRQCAEWTNGLIFYHRRPARYPSGAAACLHCGHVIIFHALKPARTMNQIAVTCVVRQPKLPNRYICDQRAGCQLSHIVIVAMP
jgi:hypothetical protein